jgi:LysR family glycine cleavage system transcriptional activator
MNPPQQYGCAVESSPLDSSSARGPDAQLEALADIKKRVPKQLPSVESLRCFLAAAHHLNFRRAAAEVGLTPTAVSERIRSLEAELDCRLFTRTTRRVELTTHGESLLPAAERALGEVQECVAAVRGHTGYMTQLQVGTRFELGMSWLVPAFVKLERQKPELQIDSYFGSGDDIVDRLERGLLDCIVTSAPLAHANWKAHVLHPEAYAFVGAATLLEKRPLRSVSDASMHTLLDVDSSLPLARYLLSAAPGLEFGGVRACGAGAAVLARALVGGGVAVLPTYMIEAELKSRRLIRLLPKVRLLSDSFRLVHREGHRFAPALRELAQYLRKLPLS